MLLESSSRYVYLGSRKFIDHFIQEFSPIGAMGTINAIALLGNHMYGAGELGLGEEFDTKHREVGQALGGITFFEWTQQGFESHFQ